MCCVAPEHAVQGPIVLKSRRHSDCMEAHEGPRRFSASSPLIRPRLDDGVHKRSDDSYGAIVSDAGEEEEALIEGNGEITTSAGKETKLLIKVSQFVLMWNR